jgi:hypothetical protein
MLGWEIYIYRRTLGMPLDKHAKEFDLLPGFCADGGTHSSFVPQFSPRANQHPGHALY